MSKDFWDDMGDMYDPLDEFDFDGNDKHDLLETMSAIDSYEDNEIDSGSCDNNYLADNEENEFENYEEQCEIDNDELDVMQEIVDSNVDTGVFKYFNESLGYWDFEQALIDKFPELAEDYEFNDRVVLSDIICETYEIDKERAVKYLKWLWQTFTLNLFDYENDNNQRYSYMCHGDLIYELISNNSKDMTLYNLLINDPDFLNAAFYDCVHEKHNYDLVAIYMDCMVKFDNVKMAKKVYQCYLDGQKGRYTNNDLGKLWMEFINSISFEVISSEQEIDYYKSFIPLIEEIGVRGEKVLCEIYDNIKQLEEDLNFDNDDEVECDDLEESIVDKYAWREKIQQADFKYANPYDFETEYEYRKARISAVEKERKEKYVSECRKTNGESNVYSFCKVDILTGSKSAYYYLVGEKDIKIGDIVIVPFGYSNTETEAKVVAVGQCYSSAFPCSVEQVKTIIRKK